MHPARVYSSTGGSPPCFLPDPAAQPEVGSCSRCSVTGLGLLSWAIAHHLLFTASAVWETLNQMAVTTEMALKVCEASRGVPSGWFAATQDRAATVESRSW